MTQLIDPSELTVVTATALETRAARRALGGARVVRIGVGASRSPAGGFGGAVVSCGLAGGTLRTVPTGSVLVPSEVAGPDGVRRACDALLVDALATGARRLGLQPVMAPLYTGVEFVRGADRARYAAMGFAGVDMETAFIPAARLAAVRVILDTPERELSEAWLSPIRVLFAPAAWRELPWLLREGPRCASLAARVVAAALL